MGQHFLMDTNVIIDYLGNKLPKKEAEFIENLPINISVVTRIELIGRHNATRRHIQSMNSFLSNATVYELDETIILQTIDIRQKYKIKLPDAIIAATALSNNLTLITHDVFDYNAIKNLRLINSWQI